MISNISSFSALHRLLMFKYCTKMKPEVFADFVSKLTGGFLTAQRMHVLHLSLYLL
jgi:hypothetical protein